MSRQSRMFLLCGFIIILSLLQGSAANNCSSVISKCSSPRVLFMFNHSKECFSHPTYTDTGTNGIHHELTYFSYGSALVYVLVDLAPLMIYFPLLILFNVNLASGPAQSFLFFYQVTPAAVATIPNIAFIWGLLTMQSPINDIVFPRVLPFIALQYCKPALVVVVVVMTVVLVKCIACPCASWRRPWAKLRRSVRHFRERRALKGTVLNGMCSIAILTYGFVIQQSFSVPQPAKCCPDGNKRCFFYCRELQFFEDCACQVPFFLVAIFSLVLVLPLPFLLLYYPCVPARMQCTTKRSSPLRTMSCHKLAPVFDVFQSAYKPKLRFFAAFPLLYRFGIWLLFSGLSAETRTRDCIIALVFIGILAIHSLVQPYSNPRHNYIETLYLVNLVLISVMSAFSLNLYQPSADTILLVAMIYFSSFILALLPILVIIGYFFWKCNCCKRCKATCCKRANCYSKRNRRESAQEEEVQELPFEAYLDLDEADAGEHTDKF